MSYELHDLVGNTGVLLLVSAYLLLQIRILDAQGLTFSVMNAFGAAFILYSLMHDFNLSAVLIESCWLIISIIGIAVYFLSGKHGRN